MFETLSAMLFFPAIIIVVVGVIIFVVIRQQREGSPSPDAEPTPESEAESESGADDGGVFRLLIGGVIILGAAVFCVFQAVPPFQAMQSGQHGVFSAEEQSCEKVRRSWACTWEGTFASAGTTAIQTTMNESLGVERGGPAPEPLSAVLSSDQTEAFPDDFWSWGFWGLGALGALTVGGTMIGVTFKRWRLGG